MQAAKHYQVGISVQLFYIYASHPADERGLEMNGIRFRICLLVLTSAIMLPTARSAVIEGVVYQYQGGPVAPHVEVKVSFRPSWIATTNSEGHFRLEDVTPGEWSLVCRPQGYLPAYLKLRVEEGDTLDVELVLRPRVQQRLEDTATATLKVFVVGGPRGLPLTSHPVQLSGPAVRTIRTNRFGRAEFTELPPGRYTLRVSHPEFGLDEREITIPPGGIVLEQILSVITPPEEDRGD